MKKLIIATALLTGLAGFAAAPALAYDGPNRLNVPAEKWLSPSEMTQKLQDQGYKVYEIESDDGAYEVDMTDKDGTRIEAHVHPETGEILPGYDD